jgi:hypothetical protein
MIDVVVVVDGEQDFAVDLVGVVLEEIAGRLGQPGELLGRVAAVEAFDEAPDLRALADEFTGIDAEAVNLALVDIGLDEQHGRFRGAVGRGDANLPDAA